MLTAVAVVREIESAPSQFSFDPGDPSGIPHRQTIPYAVIAFASFGLLFAGRADLIRPAHSRSLAVLLLGRRSMCWRRRPWAFCCRPSGTQVAAFRDAIISLIPALNFSGLLVPVSSLSAAGRWPAPPFRRLVPGHQRRAFTKGLGFTLLWPDIAALGPSLSAISPVRSIALKKQEA